MTSFTAIPAPLTIRKVRGKLLVNINSKNEPVVLVRQVSNSSLEVHLRNGATYLEKFTPKEVKEGAVHKAILDMAGMCTHTLFITVRFRFYDLFDAIDVVLDTPEEMESVFDSMVKNCYPPSSYINSFETKIVAHKYSRDQYDHSINFTLTTLCRDEDLEHLVTNLQKELEGQREFSEAQVLSSFLNRDATYAAMIAQFPEGEELAYDYANASRLMERLESAGVTVYYAEP